MSVVLLGYRGSGKTTLGQLLASRLWQSFVDVDDLITKRAGANIRDIFATHGEPHFRDLEEQAVRDALKLDDHVISLGGGAVLRPTTQDLLRSCSHKRIYLRCEPAEIARRLTLDPNTAHARPRLTGTSAGAADLAEITQVLAAREPIYRSVMTAELDVTHLSPDEALQYIARLM